MKKFLILLFALYIGMFVFYKYKERQDKVEAEKHKRYSELSLRPWNLSPKEGEQTNFTRWEKSIRVQIVGNASKSDKEVIRKLIFETSKLIKPLQISFSDSAPNLIFTFKPQTELCQNQLWKPGTIAFYKLGLDSIKYLTWKDPEKIFPDQKYLKNAITRAELYVRTDSVNDFFKAQSISSAFIKMMGNWWFDLHYIGNERYTFNNYIFSGEFQNTELKKDKGHEKNLYAQFYWEKEGIYSNKIKYSSPSNDWNHWFNQFEALNPESKDYLKAHYSPNIEKYYFGNYNRESEFNNVRQLLIFSYYIISILTLLLLYFNRFFESKFYDNIAKMTGSKWLSYFAKTVTVWLILFTLLIIIQFLKNEPNSYNATIPNFVLAFAILIPANCIYLSEKIIFPKFGQYTKQQVASFIITIIVTVTCILIISTISAPTLFGPQLDITIISVLNSVIVFFRIFYNLSSYKGLILVQQRDQELAALREMKVRAELNALQSKINPHFLYNSLNSIAGLAHENANKVEQMALALSKLFRYSINKDDDDLTTIQNEIEMVRIYLDIEKVRFDEKLQYNIIVPEELEGEQIPKFIIQPLVENAIKHGTSKITGVGQLTLILLKTENQLEIKVSDNGPDFPEDLMTGYGLQNIYEKLDILYPKRYEVKLRNGENKSISVILKAEE